MIEAMERVLDDYATGRVSRREAALGVMGLALAPLGIDASAGVAESNASTFQATGLNHLGLRVTDVAHSRDFYRKHLGLTVLRDSAPGNCFLRAGSNYVGLFRSETPGVDHFCFTVDGYEARDAMSRLEEVGLAPRRQEDRVYFDDPDGLEVQLDSRFGSWPGPPPGNSD